jgi:hypothetical protein
MRVEKDVALGRERRLFPEISETSFCTPKPRGNSLESRALMLRGTRHEEGRGFGAKAVSFFELTQIDQATSRWAVTKQLFRLRVLKVAGRAQ